MIVAIDGDILLYRCGFAAQHTLWSLIEGGSTIFKARTKKEIDAFVEDTGATGELVRELVVNPVEFALHTVKLTIKSIVEKTKATGYQVFLSGTDNFRLKVDSEYKANRKDFEKPVHYQAIKDYLIKYHPTEVVNFIEADDALGMWLYAHSRHDDINQCHRCIASLDKDLDMIPGFHYNFNHDRMYWIDEDYATRMYFRQLLTGDTVDNIPGIPGMGNTTAETYLDMYDTDYEVIHAIYNAYVDWLKDADAAATRLAQNMSLLWIQREPNDVPYMYGYVASGQWIGESYQPVPYTRTKTGRIKFNGQKDTTSKELSVVD